MGVPSFFRWLSRKYPKIISPVLEEHQVVEDGVKLPIDYSAPNPNGELDNLYLDMNGIVHPCSHPENKPPPENEDEMLLAVFEYTNRVLNMARPRKVLMIAVDGVAPRAKMNQQRARRFRSARDAKLQNEAREQVLREREDYGEVIEESVKNKKTWDSNAITPGTPFMDKLATALRYWTSFKLATDPGWRNLQVIISDATVPGEGEHKIMNFIRSQRADTQYNPNTTHCIYGLDADLIFLGLATHEPHFKILREDVFANNNYKKPKPHNMINLSEEEKQQLIQQDSEKPFLWLHISVLREYLAAELAIPHLSFQFDFERAIDDWVFMCFFCGNDFLPHLPCLDVRENSIDILVDIWKNILPRMKTYLTCDGNLNLEPVEALLGQLGEREGDLFKKKYIQEVRKQEAFERRKKLKNNPNVTKGKVDRNFMIPLENMPVFDVDGNAAEGSLNLSNKDFANMRKEMNKANEGDDEAAKALKERSEKNNGSSEFSTEELDNSILLSKSANYDTATSLQEKLLSKKLAMKEEEETNLKRKIDEINTPEESESSNVEDDLEEEEESSVVPEVVHTGTVKSGFVDTDESVKLYESGYHDRYYQQKFHVSAKDIPALQKDVVKCYVEGISWVLLYYYQGCASWTWYYPYHYAPFAEDFVNIKGLDIKFDLGEPFLPYEQLMSVLPAASGHALPEIFRPLMSDPNSEIIDFYPEEFPVDMNGKKMAWQGIALLPFIDEKRLLKAVREQYSKLTDAEKARNVRKKEVLLISNKNVNYDLFIKNLYSENPVEVLEFKHFKSGLSGFVSQDEEGFQLNSKLMCPINEGGLPDLSTNLFLRVAYTMPKIVEKCKSLILNGYIPPQPMLTPQDRDCIMYKYSNRWNPSMMKYNIVPVGPYGITQYQPRVGGYRSFFFHREQVNNTQQHTSHKTQYYAQQKPQASRYQQSRFNGGNYRNNYNNNGNSNNNGNNGSRYSNHNDHRRGFRN
ncbi:5'-3' exoribonuclease 2 [Kluyveromyces marxianus DMKU3-1042]|uniref:5'-3' exoribonuclease n=2 Tax=Kluyveromyces marxianus TaxID=4911 RepID=W0T7S0_KLUMD|nr:5'-3' exoribonuclease 2 [Kluyveromyces marxianus DMKU3-1042]BAO38831.1 5'-3' exoribonuclease 2 [Kluyveromyces marxianus DMKU3-1042]